MKAQLLWLMWEWGGIFLHLHVSVYPAGFSAQFQGIAQLKRHRLIMASPVLYNSSSMINQPCFVKMCTQVCKPPNQSIPLKYIIIFAPCLIQHNFIKMTAHTINRKVQKDPEMTVPGNSLGSLVTYVTCFLMLTLHNNVTVQIQPFAQAFI